METDSSSYIHCLPGPPKWCVKTSCFRETMKLMGTTSGGGGKNIWTTVHEARHWIGQKIAADIPSFPLKIAKPSPGAITFQVWPSLNGCSWRNNITNWQYFDWLIYLLNSASALTFMSIIKLVKSFAYSILLTNSLYQEKKNSLASTIKS